MCRRAAFTLLEICLAVAIALLILGLAVPSISSLFAEQKIKESFESFDDLVRKAQRLSVSEQRPFVLIRDISGVVLAPSQPGSEEAGKEWGRMDFQKDEEVDFERPAALSDKPPMEWSFWRSGTCEPVVVTYNGPAGKWIVKYDALTARGTILQLDSR